VGLPDGNGNDIGQVCGHICLAVGIASPSGDRAIVS
jgi:hypothetical protein